jgi:hypothetical protein
MSLRVGKYGVFYGCQDYFFNGCLGKISAKRDGTPKKIPIDKKTKHIRTIAQKYFENLWTSGKMTRQEAYSWICNILNLSRDNGIISSFSYDQCKILIKEINNIKKGINYGNQKTCKETNKSSEETNQETSQNSW